MADTYTPPDGGNIIFQWDDETYTPPDGGNIVFRWGEIPQANDDSFTGTIPGNTGGTWDGGGNIYIPGNPAPSNGEGDTPPVVTKPPGGYATPSSNKKSRFSLLCVNLKKSFYVFNDTNIISSPPRNVNDKQKRG